MPKIVDHDSQKEKIAEAAWRVIQNDGMEHATVRKIAQESGLPSSSLRHYFNSQAQLLEFALKMVLDRVEKRFLNIDVAVDSLSLEEAKNILLNLLPFDYERELEMEVWLSFSVKSLSDPSLKKLSHDIYGLMYQAVLTILEYLNAAHRLKANLNVEFEAQRLHSLIDGLSIHRLIYPDKISPEQIDYILTKHLKELAE
ncbi:transcriptional regulator, TetR family [Anaerocolumna jejuensis DSM 15929]|uniref:Transcriptional regulator, TetR family n=1 Tax=Anaerocolumna jejuensis DSM 15929 TaxID=1121322 RepID=A0A1M6YYX2_9FIRM|nr:TetR family transcriptional regulator C-terminal domain-containing protein [Anaerocolumna jejuensis]SHL23491.1 transcriptional regulator, TetR family [Anaerocolumna jejuensis DSM 15929]